MAFHGCRVVAPDVEDTIYACKKCGAELIRTAMRTPTESGKRNAAAA
jgi:hypothetical protein